MNFTIRRAEKIDLDLFFHWRNDPLVRQNSFTSEPVSLDNHSQWFLGRLHKDTSYLYVVETDATPVGQIRFEVENDDAEINYSMDKDFRGQGIARDFLSIGITYFRDEYPGVKRLIARVKPDNVASNNVFEKLGFELQPESGEKSNVFLFVLPVNNC